MEFEIKKILLCTCAIIASENANTNDYTGFFGGLGLTFSVDKDKTDIEFTGEMGDDGMGNSTTHDTVYSKKHKTVFG